MKVDPFRSLQFSANEDDVRRAALLNELVGNFRKLVSSLKSGGHVDSFTAGEGLVNSGTETDPVADVGSLDDTIVVEEDGIRVGMITGENIEDGSIGSNDVDDSIATTSDVARLLRELQQIRLLLEELKLLELEVA